MKKYIYNLNSKILFGTYFVIAYFTLAFASISTHYSLIKTIVWLMLIYLGYKFFELLTNLFKTYIKVIKYKTLFLDSYENDLKIRKSLIIHAALLFTGVFLSCLAFMQAKLLLDINDSFILEGIISKLSIFLGIILITYLANTRFGSGIAVLSSTFMGFYILLFSILLLLVSFVWGVSHFFSYVVSGEYKGDFLDSLSHIGVFQSLRHSILGFIFMSIDYNYLFTNIILAITIPLGVILVTPRYSYKQIKIILIIVNYVFNILILILIFTAKDSSRIMYPFFSEFDFNLLKELVGINYGQVNETIFKNIFERFINVSLIPYIVGSFIGLIVMEIIQLRSDAKAKKFYLKAYKYHIQNDKEKTIYYLKKCVLSGGDMYELFIHHNPDFFIYFEELFLGEEKVSWIKKQTDSLKFLIKDIYNYLAK